MPPLRKALNTLPETLDVTYDRILSNIDKEHEDYALKVFQWLCFSARQMRIDEMVEVLAIDSTDNFCFSPEQRLPDPCDILTVCSTLVSVTAAATENTSKQTTGSQELRLAHFSVKEYLISERLKKGLMHCYHITSFSANISIAQTWLTYLLHFERPDFLTAEFDHEFPLIKYAAEFWPWHYRSITNDGDRKVVDRLGCNLVESETLYLSDRVLEWVGGKTLKILLMWTTPMSKMIRSRSRRGRRLRRPQPLMFQLALPAPTPDTLIFLPSGSKMFRRL